MILQSCFAYVIITGKPTDISYWIMVKETNCLGCEKDNKSQPTCKQSACLQRFNTKWNRIQTTTKNKRQRSSKPSRTQRRLKVSLQRSHQFLSVSQLYWLSKIVTSIDCTTKRLQATLSHMPSHSTNGFGDKRIIIIKKNQLLAFRVSFTCCEKHWMAVWWSGTFQVSGTNVQGRVQHYRKCAQSLTSWQLPFSYLLHNYWSAG